MSSRRSRAQPMLGVVCSLTDRATSLDSVRCTSHGNGLESACSVSWRPPRFHRSLWSLADLRADPAWQPNGRVGNSMETRERGRAHHSHIRRGMRWCARSNIVGRLAPKLSDSRDFLTPAAYPIPGRIHRRLRLLDDHAKLSSLNASLRPVGFSAGPRARSRPHRCCLWL